MTQSSAAFEKNLILGKVGLASQVPDVFFFWRAPRCMNAFRNIFGLTSMYAQTAGPADHKIGDTFHFERQVCQSKPEIYV